jgi:hypothetical protein
MSSHLAMQNAMRTRLLSLVVATTGTTTLAATLTGYSRTTGSFIADGLAPGMEIVPSGFSTNPVGVITDITPLTLSVTGVRSAQVAAAGRSLVVGLPSLREWENEELIPVVGEPYVEEQYIPGPAFAPEIGPGGRIERRPMYSPRIFVRAKTAIAGNGRYGDAILSHFAPGLQLTASDGTILRVRDDVAPTVGQRLPGVAVGWSCVPITIPFQTLN